MKTKFPSAILFAGALALGLTQTNPARAAAMYFQSGAGADNNWNTTSLDWAAASGGPYNQVWSNLSTDPAIFELTAGTVTVAPGTVANRLQFGVTGYTLTGGDLQVNSTSGGSSYSTHAIIVPAGQTATINSSLSNPSGQAYISSGVSSANGGTVVFGGVNSFTADVYICGVTLVVNDFSALNFNGSTTTGLAMRNWEIGSSGVSTLSYTGGSATFSNYGNNRQALVGKGQFVFNITQAGTTLTLDQSMLSNNGQANTLVKTGAGTLLFATNNTYANGGGSTIINGGTLLANNSGSTGANYATGTGAVTVNSGGTFGSSATGRVGGAVTYNAGANAVFTNGATLTFAGTLTLNGNTVHLLLPANLPAGIYPLATYTAAGSSGAFNAAPVLDSGSFASGLSGIISTGGGQVLLTVSTPKLYWGAGTANWDTTALNWNLTGNGTSITNYVDNSPVVFDDSAAGAGPFTVTLNIAANPLGVTVTNATKNYTITGSGVITGGGSLAKSGAGTLTLGTANAYAGGTTISAGALQLGNANAVSNSTVTVGVANGLTFGSGIGTFNLGGLAGAGNVALTDTGSGAVALQTGNNNANNTYAGVLSGAGSLTKNGTGTLTLSSVNSFAGTTTIAGGLLQLGVGNALGSSAVTLNGGGLYCNLAGGTVANNIGIGANGGTIRGRSGAVDNYTTFSGALTGAGSGGVTFVGLVDLSNTGNNFTGNAATALPGGVAGTYLRLSANNALPATAVLTVGAGSFMKFNSGISALTLAGRAGAGGIWTDAAGSTLTINGSTTNVFSGSLGVNFTAGTPVSLTVQNGVQMMTGNNYYGGVTMINGGTLAISAINNGGSAGALGQSSSANGNLVLGGGTLQYLGIDSPSSDRGFTLTGGTTSTIDVTNAATVLTLTGGSAVTSGALIKTGAGTLNFSPVGSEGYTGDTTVSGGTLALGTYGADLASANIIVSSGATFDVSAWFGYVITNKTLKVAGTLAGPLTVNPGATLTVGGATGTSMGVMTVTDPNVTGTPLTLNGNTLLRLNKGGAVTSDLITNVSGTITLGGTLTLADVGAALAAGDAFTILAPGATGGFAAISPAYPGSGLEWNTNALNSSGVIGVMTATFAATPQLDPVGGTYTGTTNVTITCATTGATIYYTTDGSTPTTSSPVYSAPVPLAAGTTQTVKAFAVKAGLTDSAVASQTYTILVPTVATPAFSPVAGGYVGAQNVTITCATPGATIYYTTDGSAPTTGSPVYSAPVNVPVNTTMTINAFATLATYNDSAVATASYGTIATPTWIAPYSDTWTNAADWSNSVVAAGVDVTADFSAVTLFSDNAVTLDGPRTIGGLKLGDAGNAFNWTLNAGSGGPLTLAVSSGSPVINTVNQTNTINVPLSGTGGLTKTGAGALTLGAVNTLLDGPVVVNAGLLTASANTAGNPSATGSGSSANTITVNSGGVLAYTVGRAAGYNSANCFINGGTVTFGGGDNSWGAGHTVTFDAAPGVINGGGELRLRDPGEKYVVTAAASGSTISVATLTLTFEIIGGYEFNVADGAAADDLTISSAIGGYAGGESLVKTGAGTLTLAGADDYSGPTTVSNGTLKVTGSLTGVGAVNVAAGTALNVLAQGGTAVITSTGDLTLGNGVNLGFDSVTSTNVAPISAVNLVVNGAATINLTNAPAAGQYPLIKYSAAWSGAGGFALNVPSGVTAALVTNTVNQSLDLLVTTAPATPPVLTNSWAGGQLTLTWPAAYTGWTLQAQTNALNVGLNGNWAPVSGSAATNSVTIPVDPTQPAVFYRLVQP